MLALPYARFLQLIDEAAKGRAEELRRIAFLAWQVLGPFLESPPSYEQYLASLGLSERSEAEKTQSASREAIERAHRRGQEILAMMRRQKELSSGGTV